MHHIGSKTERLEDTAFREGDYSVRMLNAELGERRLAIMRTWHTQDSQGQMLDLSFRCKTLKPFQLPPLRLKADIALSATEASVSAGSDLSVYRGTSPIRNSLPS